MRELVLHCPDLREIAAPRLPEGMSFRPYRAGDESHWLRIHRTAAVYGAIADDLFRREFGDRAAALPERQIYAVDEGGFPVGTGTAWYPREGWDPAFGRVHWIAVVPAHRRRGIGRALTAEVCAILSSLGCRGAYLTTGDENVPAVSLYESMGFRRQREATSLDAISERAGEPWPWG